jgi:hypothetical protein
MVLFASAGVVAVLFRRGLRVAFDVRDHMGRLLLVMIAVLAVSFVLGTHRTGETARACLFFYPFLILAFRGTEEPIVRALALSAGVQTAAMQLSGAYFW